MLAGYSKIKKTRELVFEKYFWPTLYEDIKAYAKGCDICLVSKVVWYKPYIDLKSLSIFSIIRKTSPWIL